MKWNCMYVYIYTYIYVRVCVCVCVSVKLRVDKYICRISFLTASNFPVHNTFYVSDIHISTKSVAHYKKQTLSSGSSSGSELRVFVEDAPQLSHSTSGTPYYINYPLLGCRFQLCLSSTFSSYN